MVYLIVHIYNLYFFPLVLASAVAKSKQNVKKAKVTKQASIEKVEKTVRCFVFSTAMANRAGHAVSKGLHATISQYHAAQKWETPYLTPQIHCRLFNAAQEDAALVVKGEQKGNINVNVKEEQKLHQNGPSPDKNSDLANKKSSSKGSVVVEKAVVVKQEKTLIVDSRQKEQVIQAAQHLGRNSSQTGVEDTKANPLHPRFNLLNTPNTQQQQLTSKQTLFLKPEPGMDARRSTDSDHSPPPNNPKIERPASGKPIQAPENPIKKPLDSMNTSMLTGLTAKIENELALRKQDLSSLPPHLIPNLSRSGSKDTPPVLSGASNKQNLLAASKTSSYDAANISNLKEPAALYVSAKDFSLHKLLSKPGLPVVSGHFDTRPGEPPRSSMDTVTSEKARMMVESRMKPSPPILPLDIHQSAFINPRGRDGHTRAQSLHGGYPSGGSGIVPNGNALFNPHLPRQRTSFSPPSNLHYAHSREAIENMVDFSRNSVIIPAHQPVRPSATRANGFTESKTFEDYVPLTATSVHQHRKDRPSSLPVTEVFNGDKKEKNPITPPLRSSFSVETLTKSHTTAHTSYNNKERFSLEEEARHREIERRFPISTSHQHVFHERLPLPRELHGAPHERLHVPPNGHNINIHNNLKRTLDEQLSSNIMREQVERDRKYYEQIDWLRKSKERHLMEFDRLNPHRPAFGSLDPRTPHHMPLYFPPTGIPANGHRELPSPPHHRHYSPYGRR